MTQNNILKEGWYLKLHEWNKALSILEEKKDNLNTEDILGKLECYSSLSDWEKVSDTVEVLWEEELKNGIEEFKGENSSDFNKNKIAEYASYASWNLKNWEKFQEYTNLIDDSNAYQKNFFQSVINIQHNEFKDAAKCIDKCRQLIDPKIKSLALES